MNTPQSDLTTLAFRIEKLEQALRMQSDKLDKLVDDLPNRFLTQAQYETRHNELIKRVEANEEHTTENDKRITDLHNTSMSWVNDAFTDIRELIVKKSEEHAKQLSDLQIQTLQKRADNHSQVNLVLISVGIGAVLSFVSTVILHFLHII